MGIFDIFKKKHNNTVPPPPPIPAINTIPPIPEPQKTSKALKDFFKVDIVNLRPDDGESRIVLENPELGIFNYVDFNFPNDGTVNIQFLSLHKRFSPELIEFINSCAKTFGPTKQGDTVITEKDKMLLLQGVFSRLWDKVWIDVTTDPGTGLKAIDITIFNVAKSALIEMKL